MVVNSFTQAKLLSLLRSEVQGSSQRQVAMQIGVSKNYLSMVLSGKKLVSPRIAEFLLQHPVVAETIFRRAS